MKTLIFSIGFFLLNFFYTQAQINLIGVCSEGGDQFGSIIKYNGGDTVVNSVHKLSGIAGASAVLGCVVTGNKIYGITSNGGAYNEGTIFEYIPASNTYNSKHDFTQSEGYVPCTGAMILASNNKMYGMTKQGGDLNEGVIYEFDYTLNVYNRKINLQNTIGSLPLGGLAEASNGKLYGITSAGGANNKGVIFEYDFV